MDKENINVNAISKEILGLNNAALQAISDEDYDKALEFLKEAEKKVLKYKSQLSDPKIQIIINHNLACCYQKQKNIQKCIYHLEKVNTDFELYLENKHKIHIDQTFFIEKILSDNPQPNILLGDFILELRFCAKFHLQMCAAYSQNTNNKEALNHAKLAALICMDNISKTYHLFNQTKGALNNEEIYSKIFLEKVKENETIIISLYKYIIEIAKNFNTPVNMNMLTVDKISSFISNQIYKVSTRNILGIIKSDDWLNQFNIGNIMFLCAMSYDDLDLDSDPKYELLRDAIIEKILMLTVGFFSISNELRFLHSNTDEGPYYHSKALEISCLYLPSTCPIIKHYVTSYIKAYGNGNQLSQLDVLFNKNKNSETTYDISKDPILNIGDKEIKIVETFSSTSNLISNTANYSMNNTGLFRNESGQQAKTERKREVKSALTGRSAKGSSLNRKVKNNNTKTSKESVSPVLKENKKITTANITKKIVNNNYNHNSHNMKNTYNFTKDVFSFKKMIK